MPGFFEHAYVIGNCASNKLLISLHAHNYGEVFIFYSNRSQKSFVIYTTEGNDTFFVERIILSKHYLPTYQVSSKTVHFLNF